MGKMRSVTGWAAEYVGNTVLPVEFISDNGIPMVYAEEINKEKFIPAATVPGYQRLTPCLRDVGEVKAWTTEES